MKNIDERSVAGFGSEWKRFDYASGRESEIRVEWDEYFQIFPKELFSPRSVGADFGCGSGRFARLVADRVGHLYCVDASLKALDVAETNLEQFDNVTFLNQSLSDMTIPMGSLDFAYCLGVLHHVPDTQHALNHCAAALKSGSPLLLYLYYAFDNRPIWYRIVWKLSDILRRLISKLPFRTRYWVTQAIALVVYWPLARGSLLLEKLGFSVEKIPLSYYRNKNFYVLRTDALDRFGTHLEKRYTRNEITRMMGLAGLVNVQFSNRPPYWVALGFRR